MAMDLKKFKGSPFGIQKIKSSLGPGCYDDSTSCFSELSMMKKALSSPGWARALYVENQSKVPHILHREEWYRKKMQKQNLGPCTYEPKDFISILASKPSSIYGICHTSEERFKTISQNTPGPGTYKPGNSSLEEKSQRTYGTVGIIDARIPRKERKYDRNPGPGTYEIKSGIDSVMEKVVGNRGPYELFTGPRTLELKTGHYSGKLNKYNPCPGQYELKSNIDQLLESNKSLQGKFGKCERWNRQLPERIFCTTQQHYPKDPNMPGPGFYNIAYQEQKSMSRNLPPFDSSASRTSQPFSKTIASSKPVAPDRYDIQLWHEKQPVNGHRSVFLSKTKPLSDKLTKTLEGRLQVRRNIIPDDVIRHNTSFGVTNALITS